MFYLIKNNFSPKQNCNLLKINVNSLNIFLTQHKLENDNNLN